MLNILSIFLYSVYTPHKRSVNTIILAIFIVSGSPCFCQKENHFWLSGFMDLNTKPTKLDTGFNKLFGGNIFDFRYNPVKLSRNPKNLSLNRLVVNYCDKVGNLLFYSNGSKIFNYNHELIENADSLNYSKDWENPADSGYYALRSIALWSQSMLAFRSSASSNQFHIVSLYLNWGVPSPDFRSFTKIQYSLLDMSLNNGKGKLITKEKVIDTGNFGNGVWACKKANGVDWWIFVRSMNKSNCFHKYSLDTRGLTLETEKECIGYTMWSKDNDTLPNIHVGNFSHDGNFFVLASLYGLEIFDFNRCTGKFSNRRSKDYPIGDSFGNLSYYAPSSVFFSPNSKYLYYSNAFRIFQYDLSASDFFSSSRTVAIYDGFKDHLNGDTNLVGFPTYFRQGTLAPDGRVYVGHPSTRYMSYFENPNERGLASNFKQHAIRTESYCGNPPYHPNYSLEAIDCCGGGINTSTATDIKSLLSMENFGQYQWLYCDSSYKPIPFATEKHYTPKTTGYFAVDIKKEYCRDTSDCAYFAVTPSSIVSNFSEDIRIYPNPASDYIEISLSNVIPTPATVIPPSTVMLNLFQHPTFTFTNLLGQSLSPPVTSTSGRSQYSLDVHSLPPGIYLLHIRDKNVNLIKTERIVIAR